MNLANPVLVRVTRTAYERVANRRKRAHAAGLCITCCTERPEAKHSVCGACSAKATQRTLQRRAVIRKRTKVHRIVELHERAGNDAFARYFYEDAVRHFEEALKTPEIEDGDRERVFKRLASAVFLQGDVTNESPLLAHLWKSSVNTAEASEKTFETLKQIGQQCWLECRTEEVLPMIARMMEQTEANNDTLLLKRLNGLMASYLVILGRYDEAASCFSAASTQAMNTTKEHDPHVPSLSYFEQALYSTIIGRTDNARDYFERAVQAAQRGGNGFSISSTWEDYAWWAKNLGELDIAKAGYEQALFLARRHNIQWRISYLCLLYADLLAYMGYYERAHEYVFDALAHDVRAPKVAVVLAAVGIPIALRMKDEQMLARCMESSAIGFAFQSGESGLIGHVAVAFVRLYVSRGDMSKACSLLHRAIHAVQGVEARQELAIEVARFGSDTDIALAQTLLEKAEATHRFGDMILQRELFDMFVSQRHGRIEEARAQARKLLKAQKVGVLSWYAYADLARSILPEEHRGIDSEVRHEEPFSNIVLTQREREVALLALKGLTNRAIAAALSIRENTIEKHMTAIMHRLGIRSRHQLAETDAFRVP